MNWYEYTNALSIFWLGSFVGLVSRSRKKIPSMKLSLLIGTSDSLLWVSAEPAGGRVLP